MVPVALSGEWLQQWADILTLNHMITMGVEVVEQGYTKRGDMQYSRGEASPAGGGCCGYPVGGGAP